MSSSECGTTPLPSSRGDDLPQHSIPDYSIRVPVDIWGELGEQPGSLSQRDYCHLRLTCKLFSEIFEKMVFRELRHQILLYHLSLTPGRYLRHGSPPAAAFKWTQSYTMCTEGEILEMSKLHLKSTDKDVEEYETALRLFARSLKMFTNLRNLMLDSVVITEDLITSIASLSPLGTVNFRRSTFSCRFVPLESRINAESLEFSDSLSDSTTPLSPLHLFSSKQLRKLVIISTEGQNIVTSLTQQGPSEHLQKLEVHIGGLQDVLPLFPFFATCPGLEDINIEDDLYSVIETRLPSLILDGLSIPAAALPRLCKFKGPSKLASILVPGRPVSYLRVHFGPWEDAAWEQEGLPMLKNFSRSSAKLRVLRLDLLPARLEVMTTIATLFPDLQHLKLFLNDTAFVLMEEMEEGSSGLDGHSSTIVVDDEGNPLSSPNSLKGIVERLALGILKLPPSIKELFMYDFINRRKYYQDQDKVEERQMIACMTRRTQHHAVCELSKVYPFLTTVAFAYGAHWVKDDNESRWRLEFQRGSYFAPW